MKTTIDSFDTIEQNFGNTIDLHSIDLTSEKKSDKIPMKTKLKDAAMINIKSIESKDVNLSTFDDKIHRLALQMPLMSKNDFEALVKSIDEVGQLEPILTYRGFVIDGRNRINALKSLGRETVIVQALPHKTEMNDLVLIINAKEARRKQTRLQLAISGYNIWTNTGEKQETVAKRLGISDKTIRRVKELVEKLGMPRDVLVSLHNGNDFTLNAEKCITTNKLESIYHYYLARSKAIVIEEEEKDLKCEVSKIELNEYETRTIEAMLTIASTLSELGRLQFMNKFHELKE